MKRILLLFISVFSLSLGFGQIVNEPLTSGSLPTGWSQTSVTFTSYARFTSLSSVLTSSVFDASAFASIEVDFQVAKWGSGTDGPITLEYSDDNGVTWSTVGNSTTPTSSTYQSNTLSIPVAASSMLIRFNRSNSPSEKRLKNVVVTGVGIGSTDTELNFVSATYSAGEGDGTVDLCVDITNPSATTATTAYVVLTSPNTPHIVYPTTAITFPADSSTQQCVTVSLTDNAICGDAADYTFEIQSVSGGTNAAAGSTDETTLSVSDDEGTSGVIAFQGFEGAAADNWGYSLNPSTYNTSGDVWAVVNSVSGISPATGSSFWGMIDLNNGNGGGGFLHTLTFTQNTASATGVEVSFKWKANGYDSGDILNYEIKHDGTGQGLVEICNACSSGWNTVTLTVPDAVNSIELVLGAEQNGGDYAGFDDISISGTQCLTPEPEINIQGNATDIPSGNTTISTTADTDFGDVLITGGSQANTFTIQNTGTADLTLTSVASSNATDFVVSGTTSGVIAAGNDVTFTVTFDPSTTGTKTATITIVSDDADEATYTFDVAGNATDIPSIVLNSSNPAVAAGNIQADADIDNTVIYAFDLTVTNFDADLTAFDFTTQAGYAAGNVTNFKAWYSSDATFNSGTDVFLNNLTSGLGAGSHSFTGFSQTIANGSTGYIFITADLPCGATANNTITVSAITTTDLTFTSGTATGTAYDGGTQTITEVAPNNVTALATANCENGGVDVSWTTATGCEDNYIVVASPTALTTAPSGNGISYTADAVYGSGTAYDGGYVVYKGTGASVSISGLTNGTNYTYTVFTRNGDSWSAGVEVDCTPNLIYCTAGPTSSSDSEIENVVLNGENNNISNTTTDVCTGATGGFVNDFTAQSADLNQGDSYTLSVEFGDCNNGGQFDGAGGVWIDWNNDGDFDDTDEEIGKVDVAVSGGNVVETFTINVSITQPIGNYRMRVVQEEGGDASSISPCGTFSWGSVEDYTVEVIIACTPSHTFTSMIPTSGPEETEITVMGTGFTASTTASFGGVAAIVDFVDATTLIVHVPAGAASGEIILTESACTITTGIFTVTAESGSCISSSGTFTDLFISEVYDADANNVWYVELYNPTASPIDLAAGDYEIDRYADLTTTTVSSNANLTGVVPAYSTFLLSLGTSTNTCPNTFDFNLSLSGINAEDRNVLTKGGVDIDAVEFPNQTGYTIKRLGTATGPTATYNAADWDLLLVEDCSDLGVAPVVSYSNPTVSAITDASDCFLLDYSITATEGDLTTTADLTYQWYFNDGVNTGWTTVTSALPAGLTILGEDGDNLLIEGGVNPLNSIENYQFYCEVIEAGTCENVSNAEKFTFDNERFFRSVLAGNWDVAANWEMATSATGPWSAACTYPTETNSDYISIESGSDITLNIDLAADQIIVQNGAVLFLDEKLTVANGNASGEDLEVIGTLNDQANSLHSVSFTNGGTWELAANGTIIKTNTSSAVTYRDNYETGISNIPASANWIYRHNGTASSVSVASSANGKPMFYPNLSFESTSGNHDFASSTEIFTGYYEKITIKGDLNIGLSGNDVTVINNNFNTDEVLIEGDLYIAAGSELTNETYRSFGSSAETGSYNSTYREGAGFELKGDALIEGVLDLSHFSSSFTNPSGAKLSGGEGIVFSKGTSLQSILGDVAESFIIHNASVETSMDVELTDIDMLVNNRLIFSNGKIITDVTTSDMVFVTNQSNTAIIGSVAQSGTTKYVEGKLQWTTDGSSSYTFPIGEASNGAQGFTITPTGSGGENVLGFLNANSTNPLQSITYCDLETHPGGGTVNAGNGNAGYDGVLDQITFNVASPLQWNVTNPNSGITEYDITVLASGAQSIPSVVTSANGVDVRFLLKNGQAYNGSTSAGTSSGAPSFNTTGFSACPNQYSLSGMTSFSQFTLNGATQGSTTLPVELLYFQAENKAENVLVSWATATEINNDFFTVERSKNGEDFVGIGEVQGAGNYSGKLDYQLLDEKPLDGISYYRLKQTDFDGSFEYSKIVSVSRNNETTLIGNIYPNPVSEELNIPVSLASGEALSIQIFDVTGRIVFTQVLQNEAGFSIQKLDVSNLLSGTYYINLTTDLEAKSFQFIKN